MERVKKRKLHIHRYQNFKFNNRKRRICVSKNDSRGCGKIQEEILIDGISGNVHRYWDILYDPRVEFEDQIPNPRRWVDTPEYYLSKHTDDFSLLRFLYDSEAVFILILTSLFMPPFLWISRIVEQEFVMKILLQFIYSLGLI